MLCDCKILTSEGTEMVKYCAAHKAAPLLYKQLTYLVSAIRWFEDKSVLKIEGLTPEQHYKKALAGARKTAATYRRFFLE